MTEKICSVIARCEEMPDETMIENVRKKLEIYETLESIKSNGISEFLTDCEIGWTFLAAEMIANLKRCKGASLYIEMPFEEQASLWSTTLRNRYFAVHNASDKVHIFTPNYYEGCRADCIKEMLSRSATALFIGDGCTEYEQYAVSKNIEIIHTK